MNAKKTVEAGTTPAATGDDALDSRRVRALVRLSGEISIKSRRTRARFQKRLVGNLQDAFDSEGVDATTEDTWSRFYVSAPNERVFGPLSRVFGVSSFSPLLASCEAELERIVSLGTDLFGEQVKGRRFAVRARRHGSHDFNSADVMRDLGTALNPGATVDLGRPDVVARVEVRGERAYFYGERMPGQGGLPLGVQGKALALISGGFDSAVAAWMVLRRGVALDYVFCNLGGAAYKRMVVEVTKLLADRWSYGTYPRLHVVEFADVVEEMRQHSKPAYLQVVLKRLMYRAGSEIARRTGADALVTGESVGQVSSQTLKNLRAIDDAADFPVFRPLLGFHKEEIVDRTREIGTYELCARVREYCSVAPDKPVIASSPEEARLQEEAVGTRALDKALRSTEVLNLRSMSMQDIVGANLFVSAIGQDVEIIDTRDASAFRAWHWPEAIRRDLADLERSFRSLEKDRTYVLVCAEGIRTAFLAEQMQEAGYEAYSFRGGEPALRRYAASRKPPT
jgi:thiamine biosynthesis protein ThiI